MRPTFPRCQGDFFLDSTAGQELQNNALRPLALCIIAVIPDLGNRDINRRGGIQNLNDLLVSTCDNIGDTNLLHAVMIAFRGLVIIQLIGQGDLIAHIIGIGQHFAANGHGIALFVVLHGDLGRDLQSAGHSNNIISRTFCAGHSVSFNSVRRGAHIGDAAADSCGNGKVFAADSVGSVGIGGNGLTQIGHGIAAVAEGGSVIDLGGAVSRDGDGIIQRTGPVAVKNGVAAYLKGGGGISGKGIVGMPAGEGIEVSALHHCFTGGVGGVHGYGIAALIYGAVHGEKRSGGVVQPLICNCEIGLFPDIEDNVGRSVLVRGKRGRIRDLSLIFFYFRICICIRNILSPIIVFYYCLDQLIVGTENGRQNLYSVCKPGGFGGERFTRSFIYKSHSDLIGAAAAVGIAPVRGIGRANALIIGKAAGVVKHQLVAGFASGFGIFKLCPCLGAGLAEPIGAVLIHKGIDVPCAYGGDAVVIVGLAGQLTAVGQLAVKNAGFPKVIGLSTSSAGCGSKVGDILGRAELLSSNALSISIVAAKDLQSCTQILGIDGLNGGGVHLIVEGDGLIAVHGDDIACCTGLDIAADVLGAYRSACALAVKEFIRVNGGASADIFYGQHNAFGLEGLPCVIEGLGGGVHRKLLCIGGSFGFIGCEGVVYGIFRCGVGRDEIAPQFGSVTIGVVSVIKALGVGDQGIDAVPTYGVGGAAGGGSLLEEADGAAGGGASKFSVVVAQIAPRI